MSWILQTEYLIQSPNQQKSNLSVFLTSPSDSRQREEHCTLLVGSLVHTSNQMLRDIRRSLIHEENMAYRYTSPGKPHVCIHIDEQFQIKHVTNLFEVEDEDSLEQNDIGRQQRSCRPTVSGTETNVNAYSWQIMITLIAFAAASLCVA